jgi:toxin-antitoxin system PIN domain toxin
MKPALLDVNSLIALVDQDHVDHPAMQKWFSSHHKAGWATCPITENGMVRVLSQPAYPSGQRTPTEVIQVLIALKTAFAEWHHFWADDLSIADDQVFESPLIATTRQVTDVYLLGLAARHNATLVSFDRSLAWQPVRGGSKALIQRP